MRDDNVVFSARGGTGLPRARARFLGQAIQLEEQGPSRVIRTAIYFTVLLLIAAVLWAWSTKVNEMAVAQGEVIPAGHIHDIQHLEGGIVSEIRVRNGDQVEQSDLLLRFAPSAMQSELEQTMIRKAALEMEAERLSSIVERRPPNFGDLSAQYPHLAEKQKTIYLAQMASHGSELKVADAQIRQRKTELNRQQNQAESVENEIALLEEQVKIRTQLAAKKLVAKTELISTQSRLAETQSERRKIYDSIIVAQSALEESGQRRLEIETRFNKDIELEAGKVAAKLAEVEQSLVRLQDRVTRLDVKAPVTGIVQGLSITRINAVVDPGQVIMQIVPTGDELIVEARVSPNDIGHIHTDQPADVKIDSYDSARFGTVKGRVKQISAFTYLDEKRNPYYRAEIELEKSWMAEQPDKLRIIPGMTVKADIKTGSKTILDYVLKPVSRGFSSAFRER